MLTVLQKILIFLGVFQRGCEGSRLRDRGAMVGRHGVLESSILHAGQETSGTRRGSHKGRGRWHLQVSRRFPDRPDAKFQSQFNGDR